MKEIEVILPKEIMDYKGDPTPNPFKGTVTLKIFKASQKGIALKEAGISINKEGEAEVGDDPLLVQEKLFKLAETNTLELNVVHEETGLGFKNFEDLEYYEEGSTLILWIGRTIMNGVRLGKISGPK